MRVDSCQLGLKNGSKLVWANDFARFIFAKKLSTKKTNMWFSNKLYIDSFRFLQELIYLSAPAPLSRVWRWKSLLESPPVPLARAPMS
jgi:hypothetical protein